MSQLALRSSKPERVKPGRKRTGKLAAPMSAQRPKLRGAGDWLAGVALGPTGARRYRLYRPPQPQAGEQLPLLVMLHGCGQDADSFAASTRMNAIAARERFLVLYPEQERLANAQGCWNWFATRSGRAQSEVALIMAAIDQVCALYRADRARAWPSAACRLARAWPRWWRRATRIDSRPSSCIPACRLARRSRAHRRWRRCEASASAHRRS